MVRRRDDQFLCQADFLFASESTGLIEVYMRKGVVAYSVAFVGQAFYYVRKLDNITAGDKKRRRHGFL